MAVVQWNEGEVVMATWKSRGQEVVKGNAGRWGGREMAIAGIEN